MPRLLHLPASLATIAACLVLAAPAIANSPRYTSPDGVGTACTAAHPCPIEEAINGDSANHVNPGDEVIVQPGSYGSSGFPLTTRLVAPVAEVIHGVAGQPRPQIFGNPSSGLAMLAVSSPGSSVRYLSLNSSTRTALEADEGTTVDQVVAHTSSSGTSACFVVQASNSTCWSSGASGYGNYYNTSCTSSHSPKFRNFDAYATGPNGKGFFFQVAVAGAAPHCDYTINGTNVIAQGAGLDLVLKQNPPATLSFTLDHSDYKTFEKSGGATFTSSSSNFNTFADPQLVDPAMGDFHELPGSPMIDHGASDPANGPADADGNPRRQGAATDIGAFEFPSPPLPASGNTVLPIVGPGTPPSNSQKPKKRKPKCVRTSARRGTKHKKKKKTHSCAKHTKKKHKKAHKRHR